MWGCIVNTWTWLSSNSGQIQIFIAVVALGFAICGYLKILTQIKISNKQTYITIQQRTFELRIRISARMADNFQELRELSNACNQVSLRLHALSVDTQSNHPGSLEVIESMVAMHRESIAKWWEFIPEEFKKNQEYRGIKNDLPKMEAALEQIEQDQNEYNLIWSGIENINKSIDSLWIPLNSCDLYEANRRLNKLG